MSRSVLIKALEVVIYGGIFVALILPVFKPAEQENSFKPDLSTQRNFINIT